MSKEIKEKSQELGFQGCGIIPLTALTDYGLCLDERVRTFPESRELYEPFYGYSKPPEDAKSVIVCTRRYNRYKLPENLDGLFGKFYLFDSRLPYAHESRARAEFEEFLKTRGMKILKSFVPNRIAAAKAGLGKFGRNNFIYDSEHGSYIWIDTWLVDKELAYDPVAEDLLLPECNDSCHRCVQYCPTKALSGALSMDRGRCITQLNCWAKDASDEKTRSQMGLWLYGCDACQDACPVNKGKFSESAEFPLLKEFEEYMTPESLLEMDQDEFINIVHPRLWYIDKDGLWLWKCNALRAMINSGEEKYHRLIKKYRENDDARVKEVAEWGCRLLGI